MAGYRAAPVEDGVETGIGETAAEELVLLGVLGGRRFGVPVSDVRCVLPMASLTPVPDAPAGVVGLLDYHGHVLPVVDPRPRLGLATPRPEVSQHLVLIAAAPDYLIWLDRVERIVSVADTGHEVVGDRRSNPITRRIARIDGELVPLLVPSALAPTPSAAGGPTNDR